MVHFVLMSQSLSNLICIVLMLVNPNHSTKALSVPDGNADQPDPFMTIPLLVRYKWGETARSTLRL